MDQLAIPTDSIKLTRTLREKLRSMTEPSADGDSCLLVDAPSIEVELYHEVGTVYVSVMRVAWALAHPEGHLTETDFAIHVCHRGKNWRRGEPVCINPDHLRKGSRKDIQHMRKSRRRRLIITQEEHA